MIRTTTALATAALGAAVALTGAAPALAAPHVRDVDAELHPGGWLHLSAETSAGARRLTFHVAGRSIRGRLTDIDREDRTREFERTVRARGVGTGTRSIRVRVCGRRGCSTQTFRTFVERDD
ncbi:MAG: hypothetical protein R2736_10945 [Solirubrobacterales bacterium]